MPEHKYKVKISWGKWSHYVNADITEEIVLALIKNRLQCELLRDPPTRIEITRLDDE